MIRTYLTGYFELKFVFCTDTSVQHQRERSGEYYEGLMVPVWLDTRCPS